MRCWKKFISVVHLLSHIQLFATPRTAARQASLSFTVSRNLLKLMSFESVMPSNHLILCRFFLLLPSIFPNIRVLARTWISSLKVPLYLTTDTMLLCMDIYQFSSVQLLSHVRLIATPRTAARQASLSITNSQSLLKLMSIASVMPSNLLILCHQVAKVLEFQLQHSSFQWIFRTDFL